MNTTEILERLSKADAEWCSEYVSNGYSHLNGWDIGDLFIRNDELKKYRWQLFGAICERIESRMWYITLTKLGGNGGSRNGYEVTINTGWDSGSEPKRLGISVADQPWQAAALAYLEALRGNDDEPGGPDSEPADFDTIVTLRRMNTDGTGKQQEVTG